MGAARYARKEYVYESYRVKRQRPGHEQRRPLHRRPVVRHRWPLRHPAASHLADCHESSSRCDAGYATSTASGACRAQRQSSRIGEHPCWHQSEYEHAGTASRPPGNTQRPHDRWLNDTPGDRRSGASRA